MATRDETLNFVLEVQARIESKVDVLASLLRECLERPMSASLSLYASPSNANRELRANEGTDSDSLAMETRSRDIGSMSRPSVISEGQNLTLSEGQHRTLSEGQHRTLSEGQNRSLPEGKHRASLRGVTAQAIYKRPTGLEGWPNTIEMSIKFSAPNQGGGEELEIHSPYFKSCTTGKRIATATPKTTFVAMIPSSPPFLVWGFFAAVIFTLDSSATGIFIIWDWPQRQTWKIVFAAFWTLDLIVSCFKKHRKAGGEMLSLRRSFKRYLKTWFTLDFSLVCFDWVIIIIMTTCHTEVSVWSIINYLRLHKFVRFVEDLTALRLDVRMVVLLRSVALLVYSIWSLHVCSCLWLAVGISSPSDTGERWLDSSQTFHYDFMSLPDFYKYATSLHWVISVANMGNIEMYCQNSVERMICAVFMLVSFFLGSIAVSYLAALFFDFRLSSRHQTEQLQSLRRFLSENAIEHEVATLVVAQAKERLSRLKETLSYADVPCLSLLSSSVVRELKYALVGRFFQHHALFRLWTRSKSMLAKDLAMATDFQHLAPGTALFKPLVEANEMCYLISGNMVFMQDVATSLVTSPRSVTVDVETWFCEPAMWTRWLHVGTMEAIDVCEVAKMRVDEAARSIRSDEVMYLIAVSYAEAFHHRVTTAGPPRTEWPDDLHVPLTNYADLVMQFPKEALLYIGMEAVDVFSRNSFLQNSWWSGQTKNLEREVKTGKCILMVNAQGDVERIASVLVLRLQNSSGQVLYELGKLSKDKVFAVAFKMPGKKRERGEEISDTIRRSPNLMKLCDASRVIGEQLQEKFEFSKEYGVRTNYLRAVQMAQLHDDSLTIVFQPDAKLICADTATHQEVQDLLSYTVCVIRDDEELLVHAWLSEEKAELLQNKTGEALIKAWMSCFDLVACFSALEGMQWSL